MCKKRGGHARIYSPKDIVKSFSLIGMVSGEKKDNVSGTGTRGWEKLNFILKCVNASQK